MSSKATIKWRERTQEKPGFKLYDDVLDSLGTVSEAPVYLRLERVSVDLRTLDGGGVSVTIALPRELARELGLLGRAPMSMQTESRNGHT